MITFVYCCVCLLIVCCQCQSDFAVSEDYTNDSPDTLPKVEFMRHKVGTDILMRCGDRHYRKQNITWEFKHCESNYKGIQCNKYIVPKPGVQVIDWIDLNMYKEKKKLEIHNSTEEDSGLYRCLYNNSVIKMYVVEVVVLAKYKGPSPEVTSMVSTNSTVSLHENLIIQCKATSTMPPEIRWFKECTGRKCDVMEEGHCYCSLMSPNSVYSIGNDVYLSKLNMYNVRNIDSGVYVCLVISLYGKDYKNITIRVQGGADEVSHKSFSLLFLIPLSFLLVPATVWMCYYRKKKKKVVLHLNGHHEKLVKSSVVQVDIVLERNIV